MKRWIVLFCLMVFVLTGCSNEKNTVSDAPRIEDYSWVMTTIQYTEDDGQIIAHAADTVGVPDSSVEIALKCSSANGELSLTDETNSKSYKGTYKVTDTNQETRIYEIVLNNMEGMAVVSMTNYEDQSQTPTFIIRFEDYSINFFSAEK